MNMEVTRVLLESTHASSTSLNTGIQRVVRNVAKESAAVSQELGVRCLPVVFRGGEFFEARRFWHEVFLEKCGSGALGIRRRIFRLLERFSPSVAELYDTFLVRLRKLFYPKTLARWLVDFYWRSTREQIVLNHSDVLMLLDASWSLPIWPAVRDARQQGCTVVAVVYDLIPITHRSFCGESHRRVFTHWLDSAICCADAFIGISKHVRDELIRYVRVSDPTAVVRPELFDSFTLGADFSKSRPRRRIRRELVDVFNGANAAPPYLHVGTVEPRKNHAYLLDAFDLIWTRRPDVRLCLVGKIGWLCDSVVARIRKHKQFGKSLLMFNDLADAELQFCYQSAKALVYPSIVEGFGLPIVESLHHRLPVLASDIPVHREVGGDFCAYFDLNRPESLAEMIVRVEQGEQSPLARQPEDYVFPTWRESCRELLVKSIRMANLATDRTERSESPRTGKAA